ncbi:Crp/Fnr family transcriptional regulator [Cellulophaga sp. 20_2_10]|uniref:Crp/Fnr family transcriptional regulator n=1 Tax=Cellulophaga sp. 20_2_10 TaxID=2942476 RepID=UPI00201A5DE5|nr:Crp/Fnr family transcriptional regulator [Cellulophaga sp. 20_2_10]MCL5246831.1 Crp/Fnr family transcriptional regulator [Cellulophaga sp. 20_2_10]
MMNNLFLHKGYSFDNQDLLSELPDAICKSIHKNRITIYFKCGDSIFIEGKEPTGIYRIKKGKVKKFTSTNFGTEHIFYVCKENEYLGYHAVLSEDFYPDSATALTDCEIEFISKSDFFKAVDKSHELAQRLLKNISREFGVFLNALKLLAKYTVRERAALNLLILESKFREDSRDDTVIIINRGDLASMVGTAKESLVRMLKDFKEEQLITTKGSSIFIKDYKGLVKASNFN